jgi:transcriptional regulator with XRE-family HTH domain
MAVMAKPRSVYVVDGPKIRRMRDRAGFSLSQFAHALGTDISHLSRIERGRGQPGVDLRNRMATVLGVTVEEIAALREPVGASAA